MQARARFFCKKTLKTLIFVKNTNKSIYIHSIYIVREGFVTILAIHPWVILG